MKQKREISRGEKIEVWLDADGSSERYLSKVEDVLDENTIIITRPVAPGKFTYLSLDQVVKIIYFRNEEAYYFDGKVIDRIKYKNSISIKIYAVSKIKKLQRRDYFRLGITVPLKISYSVDGTDIKKETYTIDISGGGLKIGCDSRFDKGTGLEIQIEIPNLNDKKLKGRVIRCRPSLKNNKVYEIGIEFQDLKPNIRQVLIKYIFAKQIELIRKGIIY